jgi:hypothetical protein
MSESPSISILLIEPVVECLERRVGAIDASLARIGIARRLLSNPDARMDFRMLDSLLVFGIALTVDPQFPVWNTSI